GPLIKRDRRFADSPVEGAGFEPSVPLLLRSAWCRRTGTTSWANRGGQLCLARSPLPDIPGQENGGGGTGQTGEPAAAETQHPGRELRRPAELIKRDAEQKRPQESRAKADAGIEPDRCPSVPRG